jgi:unsaturated rhamnogalacturonyl hydrolase
MTEVSLQLIRSIAHQTMQYPFKVWGFGEGIALEALAEASDVTDDASYWSFILDLFDRWVSRPLQESDHSAPGMLLLVAYERTGDARYLTCAHQLADHMLALPTHSGAALHRPQHPDYHDYLYVDCMEVDGPFLCKLAAVTDNSTLFDAGAAQVLAYARLLQDDDTGLFYHQYNQSTKAVNGAFWGRGNGWALLGLLKTLMLLPTTHSDYSETRQRFEYLANALIGLQAASGGWHTVLDRPDSYEETSLPAMFGYGLLKAFKLNLLDRDVTAIVERAWHAAGDSIRDGRLTGVSIATPPGNAEHYAQIAVGEGFPWGQGPLLLFALERMHTLR